MIDVSKYRFKTEEEFKKEYGKSWRDQTLNSKLFWCSWIQDMDGFFGRPLSDFDVENLNGESEYICTINDYYICGYMLTPITATEVKPKPKKSKVTVWEDITHQKGIDICCAVSGRYTEVVISFEGKVFKGKARRRSEDPSTPSVGFIVALSRAVEKAKKVLGKLPMTYNVFTGETKYE